MNVHHPVLEIRWNGKEFQKPGKTNEIGFHGPTAFKDLLAERLRACELFSEYSFRLNAGARRPLKAKGLAFVADYHSDLGIEAAVPNPVHQVLQCGAIT